MMPEQQTVMAVTVWSYTVSEQASRIFFSHVGTGKSQLGIGRSSSSTFFRSPQFVLNRRSSSHKI